MDQAGRRAAAQAFVDRWSGRGYEKGDKDSFWIDLLQNVFGYTNVTTRVRFEDSTADHGFIDVSIPEAKTLVEQKSLGVNLDKPEMRQGRPVTPFEQAKAYADSLPNSQRPSFIIVSNFQTFRIHSLEDADPARNYQQLELTELPDHSYLLDFLTDPAAGRAQREREVSMMAGAMIGRLYDLLLDQYQDPASAQTAHALNVLCVRLVFCLYAEDAGLFAKHGAFAQYLRGFSAQHMRRALLDLFQVLDQKPEDRDPYLPDDLKAFPYVNGGLFTEVTEVPNFTEDIRTILLDEVSAKTDWSEISPTIFGGIFESTLNPETRRAGGMHYTSPENIHKVIDPLFLDDLTGELNGILQTPGLTERSRRARLRAYQQRLAKIVCLDPACGSGNFLTETYICLRRLENQVLSELNRGQTSFEFEGVGESAVQVSLHQFFGIEINDFAVEVARTALWIAELQANVESEIIIRREVANLPLHDAAHIVVGNALTTNWNDVLPATWCTYVFGNPPFIGYSRLSAPQKQDRARIFGKSGGVLDYVACWYHVAAQFMQGTSIRAAFVSTNSICQGQQVQPLWQDLFQRGIHINFAHRSFVWSNEASDQAHVHVVIVGFSYTDEPRKILFTYPSRSGNFGLTRPELSSSSVERIILGRRRGDESGVAGAVLPPRPLGRLRRPSKPGQALESAPPPPQNGAISTHMPASPSPQHLSPTAAHKFAPSSSLNGEDTGKTGLPGVQVSFPSHINGYLVDGPDAFIKRRSDPLCAVTPMVAGGKPTEGGNLLLTPEERNELLRVDPAAEQWVREFSMGEEFINGKQRYCLWLVDANISDIRRHHPEVWSRIQAVRAMRLASKKIPTQKKADTPWLFDEIRYQGQGTYIGVPKVSSERRRYIPLGFVTDGMIPGDKLYFIPTDSLYIFGVMMSQVHNAWMRVVGGRLEMRYSYANTIIYNNFIWPGVVDVDFEEPSHLSQSGAGADSRAWPGFEGRRRRPSGRGGSTGPATPGIVGASNLPAAPHVPGGSTGPATSKNGAAAGLQTKVELAVASEIREEIETCAQRVLDARAQYPGATLADLYDPDNDYLYPKLTRAHARLDAAVEQAYGMDFHGDEQQIVAHLFHLYAQATVDTK